SRSIINNANGSQSAGPRTYPAFGDIQWMENRVLSNYHSMQVSLEKRFSNGLSSLVSYTWGKALTEAPDHISTTGAEPGYSTGVIKSPQDPSNLKAERGLAEFDVKHRLSVSYVYELPFGRSHSIGQNWSRSVDLVLGGWQVSGIHVAQSGLGLTPT